MRIVRQVIFLTLLWSAGHAAEAAAQICPGGTADYEPYAYETLTISSTAVPLTAANIPSPTPTAGRLLAFITVETNPVSIVFTGTPTATVGHQFIAGSSFSLCGRAALAGLKAIRVSADATLKVSYWRRR